MVQTTKNYTEYNKQAQSTEYSLLVDLIVTLIGSMKK